MVEQITDNKILLSLLKKKIGEEANEVIEAAAHDDLLEELADLSTVIEDILALIGETQNNLEIVKKSKVIRRGRFLDVGEYKNYGVLLRSVNHGD